MDPFKAPQRLASSNPETATPRPRNPSRNVISARRGSTSQCSRAVQRGAGQRGKKKLKKYKKRPLRSNPPLSHSQQLSCSHGSCLTSSSSESPQRSPSAPLASPQTKLNRYLCPPQVEPESFVLLVVPPLHTTSSSRYHIPKYPPSFVQCFRKT